MEFTSIAALCQGMWSLHLKDLLNMFEPQYIAFDCFHVFLTLATVETAAEHARALEQFRLYL